MHVSSLSGAAAALCLASLALAQKVLQLDISKQERSLTELEKLRLARRSPVTVPLSNLITFYAANVSIGTPPQQISLQVDTGSSDIWTLASSADFCQQDASNCELGTLNGQQSSTLNVVNEGGFEISYADQTSAQGDYISDVLRIGPSGSQVTINSQIMGYVTQVDTAPGIMGVGFPTNEARCGQSEGECEPYPTFLQNLVSQGVINTQAFSLWLDDLEANTGSVILGGVDTKKFIGQLITVPLADDTQSNDITSFTVAWTGLTLGTSQGSMGGFVPDNFAAPVVLDSGSSFTLLPSDVAQNVLDQFGAVLADSDQGLYAASCSLRNSTATFDFQFGGSQGPVISVPVSEFLLDYLLPNGKPRTFDNGDAACKVGIQPADDGDLLFGDTVLRSAYVVYDIDSQQVSIAQTDFSSTDSDIQEIKKGQPLPNAASTASVRVTQSATGRPGNGGSNSMIGGSAAPTLGSATGAPLAQYTAANTNNPHVIAPGTSHAAASRQAASSLISGASLWMAAAATTFVALGGGMLLL